MSYDTLRFRSGGTQPRPFVTEAIQGTMELVKMGKREEGGGFEAHEPQLTQLPHPSPYRNTRIARHHSNPLSLTAIT